jgi:alkaline phosphatase D
MRSMASFSRREFLALLAAGSVVACTTSSSGSDPGDGANATVVPVAPTLAPPTLATSPFTLGVASGDPLPDSVILWTRLAPKPLDGGGMPDQPVSVVWQVAADERFATIVAQGAATAESRLAHSVHVDVKGLTPDTWYWYRFQVGDFTSAAGRTRTVPAAGSMPVSKNLRFGFTSCQQWTNGYYTGYGHMADEKLDVVFHLGDYIYEGGTAAGDVRPHNSAEIMTLTDYRNRYALYKGDASLQAAHLMCPWITTWDDHEVENNYAGLNDENNSPPEEFHKRRALAYQAYYEHQALRIPEPSGPDFAIYRSFEYGTLARFIVIDTRQYRTNQPCDRPLDIGPVCAEVTAPGATMLGDAQRAWLFKEFEQTKATWTVLANQTIMTSLPIAGSLYNFDQWDGYPAERRLVLEALVEHGTPNPIVITGDIHAFGTGDLKVDYDDPASPVVAAEFIGGSMTSAFPDEFVGIVNNSSAKLPQVKYTNLTAHGYGVAEVTADKAAVAYRVVSTIKEPTATIQTAASFIVDAGKPGARMV